MGPHPAPLALRCSAAKAMSGSLTCLSGESIWRKGADECRGWKKNNHPAPPRPPSASKLAWRTCARSLRHTKLMGQLVELLSSCQLGLEQAATELLRSSSEPSFKGSHFRSRPRTLRCSASAQHGTTDLIRFLKDRQADTGELAEIYLPDAPGASCPHRRHLLLLSGWLCRTPFF